MTRTVHLHVPVLDALEWQAWLSDDLADGAENLQLDYDGPEEEGGEEVHEFPDADAATVAALVTTVLAAHGVRREVVVSDAAHVSIVRPDEAEPWLVPLPMPGAYGKEVSALSRTLNRDAALHDWLRSAGVVRLIFRQVPGDARAEWFFESRPTPETRSGDLFAVAQVDLRVYDRPRVSRSEVARQARANLRLVLEKVGQHLGAPPPESPALAL